MPIKLFTNPHLNLQQLEIVSRTDLYAEDDRPRVLTGDTERLQSVLSETLQPLKHDRDEDDSRPRTKRRKLKVGMGDTSVRM
jgi:hypothetical protein